jgi:EAL domain-containing protein (putative c-di-GMP-specific phosphodiesterase class I)
LTGYADTLGLVLSLGETVLRAVCADLLRRQARTQGMLPRVTIPLTSKQLGEPSLTNRVAETLAAYGVDPSAIAFVFSEHDTTADEANTLRAVHGLRQLGVGLTIRGFGAGSSSLAALTDLPVDGIRIDQTLTWALGRDRASTAIVTALRTVAHAMGLSVTAEGIDTREHEEQVRHAGIEQGQGGFFARIGTDHLIELASQREPLPALHAGLAAAG